VKRKKKPSVNSSHQPDITYIVSAFNRPVMLPVCLWSIKGQSHSDFECIVTDNAESDALAKQQERMVKGLNDHRFRYVRTANKTKVSDCYWSAEWANQHMASGRWLCFPCDDTYLVPEFAQRMLVAAAKENADYVFVKHIVASPEALGGPDTGYAVWSQRLHRTAKTSFIVKRRVFDEVGGFQGKMDRAGTVNADYFFSSQMVKAGKKIAMVSECLVVHN
jgi:GT2 family glycosyltransferase